MKIVVIGANAAGMSAASRIKRREAACEVVVLEATHEVSYGACGLPYYIAGLNDDLNLVRIRSVADFEKNGIVMRIGCAAERNSSRLLMACGLPSLSRRSRFC